MAAKIKRQQVYCPGCRESRIIESRCTFPREVYCDKPQCVEAYNAAALKAQQEAAERAKQRRRERAAQPRRTAGAVGDGSWGFIGAINGYRHK